MSYMIEADYQEMEKKFPDAVAWQRQRELVREFQYYTSVMKQIDEYILLPIEDELPVVYKQRYEYAKRRWEELSKLDHIVLLAIEMPNPFP